MQNQYTISTVRDCTLSVMYCDVTNMVVMVTMDTETMTSAKFLGFFLIKHICAGWGSMVEGCMVCQFKDHFTLFQKVHGHFAYKFKFLNNINFLH